MSLQEPCYCFLYRLFAVDGRQCVHCERGEQTTACCVQEVVPFGGDSVRVWEGICGQERTPLVIISGNLTAQCYIDDILHPTVLPVLQQQPHGVIYQQTPYSQRIVQNFLGANINMLAIVFCMLARQVPNTTPMRWHGSSCSTTSIHSSQPTRTDSGPPKKLVMNPEKKCMCIDASGGHARY